MNNHTLPRRRSLLATGSVIGMACAGMLFALPANAATTISFNNGVLKVVGDATNNSFTVGRTPAGVITLNGAQVLGGAPTVSNVSVVHLEGGAGNDVLRFDEANGPMPRGEFLGGDGRDAFKGGSANDTLVGGAGIDRGTGGPGDDTVSLGADADEFTWNPGDGNDHVDGDAGPGHPDLQREQRRLRIGDPRPLPRRTTVLDLPVPGAERDRGGGHQRRRTGEGQPGRRRRQRRRAAICSVPASRWSGSTSARPPTTAPVADRSSRMFRCSAQTALIGSGSAAGRPKGSPSAGRVRPC